MPCSIAVNAVMELQWERRRRRRIVDAAVKRSTQKEIIKEDSNVYFRTLNHVAQKRKQLSTHQTKTQPCFENASGLGSSPSQAREGAFMLASFPLLAHSPCTHCPKPFFHVHSSCCTAGFVFNNAKSTLLRQINGSME